MKQYSPKALRQIIHCALILVDMWSQDAEELLMGTAAQESHLGELGTIQVGGGPAVSVFQIEPSTERDVWENYLKYNQKLREKVTDATGLDGLNANRLRHDPIYASIMARLIYRRVKESLPTHDNIQAMAEYWKKHYNTPLGKGQPHEFVASYKRYVAV